ncbi:MAG: hypothetical protein AAGF84_05760 [Planctomycetota bacterium]
MRPTVSPVSDPAEKSRADEAVARPALVTFASVLARAIQTAKLYETQHPLVATLCQEACVALRLACGDASQVAVGVGPDRLYDGEARFSEPAEIAGLASIWHAADLGKVTFEKPLDAEQLKAGIALWISISVISTELCEQIKRATGGLIQAEPLRYERLKTTDSAAEANRSSWSWRSLFDDALNMDASEAQWEAAYAQITQKLNEVLDQSAEEVLDGLHREMHAALNESIDSNTPARPDVGLRTTVHRLGRLLETLSPQLRKSMLAAVPNASVADASASHGTERDFAAVLAAVQGLEGQLNQATCESLMMCQKLAVLADDVESEDSISSDENLVASIQEILTQHTPSDFTPEAYRQRLNEISGGIAAANPLTDKMRAAFEPDVIRKHAFDLALHIAAAGDDEPGPEAWRHLKRRLGELVQHAEIAAIAKATRAAEARLARGGPDDTLAACRDWIHTLKTTLGGEGRLGTMLDASRDPEDTATLLRYAEASALHEALRRLADVDDDHEAQVLAQSLRNLGGMLNAIAETLIAENPERRIPLVRRLAPVSFATATRWLGPLLTQKNPAGRARAFATLVEASPSWPADAAEGLLQHPDEPVRSAALHRLLNQVDPASLAAIGRVLTGENTGRVPHAALIDRAVTALLSQAAPGQNVLRSVLQSASQRRFGRRRHTLEPLVEAISKHADSATAHELLQSIGRAAA